MSKKTFIFGATDLAEVLHANLASLGDDTVEAFVVDEEFRTRDTLQGLPVIDTVRLASRLDPEEYACYVCLGYSRMNEYREQTFAKLRGMGYSILSFVHPTAQVNTITQGTGNLVFQNVLIDFFTEIGDGNIFYPNAFVAHHTLIGNFNFFAVSCCITGHVAITNNCFIGANATIGNNVTLEHHSLIGAGAYVASPVPSYEVVVPARSVALEGKISIDFF